MAMSQNLINTLLLIMSVGGVVALNLVIAGLIVIAVAHDGGTATQVASTFETILTDAVTAIGTLLGSLLTARHMLASRAP